MPSTTIRDTQVTYSDQGAGETVVLLHCTGGSGAQWRRLAGMLDGRYRVVAPDLYGYGGTDHWAGRAPISLEDEAALIASLMERFEGPVHLVGHSFGGAVALRIARQWPQRIRTLTLIEPVAFHLLQEGDAVDAMALEEITGVIDTLSRALTRGDYWGGCGHFVDYWGGQGAWASTPEPKRASLAQRLGKIVLDFWSTIHDPARVRDLSRCAVPTLVVRGGRSPHPVRRIARHIATAMPDARLAEVRAAGHMAPMTHAEEVNAMITAHLDANRAARGAQAAPVSRTLPEQVLAAPA
jgi:pimeloyl-ACP methyl ester carboxylesterase